MSSVEPNTIKLADLRSGSPEGRRALEYWKTLRGDQTIPRWAQFDPTEIPTVAAHSVFLRYKTDDDWTVTLFGSELSNRFGADITGLNIFSIIDASSRDLTISRMALLREGRTIIRSENEMNTAMDVRLVVEWLLLPFTDENGEVTYAVQVVAPLEAGIPDRKLFAEPRIGRTVLKVDIATL